MGGAEDTSAADMMSCPICNAQVNYDEINTHVNLCIDGGSNTNVSPQQQKHEEKGSATAMNIVTTPNKKRANDYEMIDIDEDDDDETFGSAKLKGKGKRTIDSISTPTANITLTPNVYPSGSNFGGGSGSSSNSIAMSDEEFARQLMEEETRLWEEKKREEERLSLQYLEAEEQQLKSRAMERDAAAERALECQQCKNSNLHELLLLENCVHAICAKCLRAYIVTEMRKLNRVVDSEIRCPTPSCNAAILSSEIKHVLNDTEYQEYLDFTLQSSLANNPDMTKCPNPSCRHFMEKVKLSEKQIGELVLQYEKQQQHQQQQQQSSLVAADNNKEIADQQQQQLHIISWEAFLHHHQNRFRCRDCDTIFCAECGTIPYHDGFTCKQFADRKTAKLCRWCHAHISEADILRNRVLAEQEKQLQSQSHQQQQSNKNRNKAPVNFLGRLFSSVSSATINNATTGNNPNTSDHGLDEVCTKNPECQAKRAFACIRAHAKCGHPCCGVKDEQSCLPCLDPKCRTSGEQTGEDYCNICWTESLAEAPCIQFTKCSHIFHYGCAKKKLEKGWPGARITFGFMNCPLCKQPIEHPSLDAVLAPLRKLQEEVQKKALARLAAEGHAKNPQITNPGERFYNDTLGYAMHNFAYYNCFKCKRPYFGGMRQCEQDAGDGNANFDPSELVCGACAGTNVQVCKKHGTDYIEHKCKFCCNIAVWFCWGTTHFCDDCHKKQVAGDYLTKKPASAHPKCPGPDKCPLGIAHPPNGEEFVLGCAMCRRSADF